MIGTVPDIGRPSDNDSNAISLKLAEIREKRIARFEPIIKPEGGLTYTGFSDHDFARQLDVLRALQERGVVKAEPFDYIRRCIHCDHHGFLLKEACPACGSTNTEQGKVIEHLPCGKIDLESKYISDGGGGLICPKCKKRLKAIGVDYVRPGSYCLCLSCSALSPQGNMQYMCLNCGRSLTKDGLKVEPLFAYVVDAPTLSKYLGESTREFQISVVNSLKKLGLAALANGTVVGSSMVHHSFDIIVYRDGSGDETRDPEPVLAIEIANSETSVGPEAVLNFFARCMDAKIPKRILVAIPSIEEEGKKLADTHGITLLESSGADPEDVAKRIVSSKLQDLLRKVIDIVEDNEEKPGAPETADSDRASLEQMIKTVITAAINEDESGKDQDQDKGVGQ